MPAPLLALAVIGKAAEAYGNYKQAQATSSYLKEKSQVSLLQADESLYRADLNVQQIVREGRKFKGEQLAQYAGAGVDISSNATLAAMEDTTKVISDQIYKTQREAEFEAFMKRKEAYSYQRSGKDIEKAAKIQTLSSLLQAGSLVGSNVRTPKPDNNMEVTPTPIPDVSTLPGGQSYA